MKKIGLICLAVVLALGSLGVGYAMWSETLVIGGTVDTGELDWEFVFNAHTQKDPYVVPPNTNNDWTSDVGMTSGIEQLDKDVGSSTVSYVDSDGDTDYDKLVVTLDNVYPSYYEHIAFKLHNNGTIPLIIQKVIINPGNHVYLVQMGPPVELDLGGDNATDIELWYGDSFATQLHPDGSVNISFDVHVLQGAPQGATNLTFTIEITAVQWNEYEPV